MYARVGAALVAVCLIVVPVAAPACCPAPPSGRSVVNADQSVIILWDAPTKTQHFIRKASFKSEADDFGFLVPSPSRPELAESGNEAFAYLQALTEPETVTRPRPRGSGCGCSNTVMAPMAPKGVAVLEEKLVAGFNAAVLEADSTAALVAWLKDNGYAFSPEVEAWAKPYVEGGWKITALKVAKDAKAKGEQGVTASALRMSFKTDRPLFPYREPDYKATAQALGANRRLLRIYFLSDAKYQGDLTKDSPWTGKVAWANKISDNDRKNTLALLKLPEGTGPAHWWMTEFEDAWPYRVAPADVYFAQSAEQNPVKRPPHIQYVDARWPLDGSAYALAAALVGPPILRRWRRRGTAG